MLVGAFDHRHLVEGATREGVDEGLRQDLAIDGRQRAALHLKRSGIGEDRRDGQGAQAGRGLRRAAGGGGEVLPPTFGHRQGGWRQAVAAAFDDRLLEEPGRQRRNDLRMRAQAASGFAEDSDVVRVAAERRDIRLDPLQRGLLIHQAVVAGSAAAFGRECGMREEAQGAQPVVDGDNGDALGHQRVAVVVVAFAGEQGTAVDPDHDRERPGTFRRVDVQIETVFRGTGDAERARRLRAVWPERGCPAWSGPGGGRLRRCPAHRADGRRGVRNAFEGQRDRGFDAEDDALVGCHRRWSIVAAAGGEEQASEGRQRRAEVSRGPCGRDRLHACLRHLVRAKKSKGAAARRGPCPLACHDHWRPASAGPRRRQSAGPSATSRSRPASPSR